MDTKNDILQQSLELFLANGIRKMSNEQLSKSLGISTKTIYKYFENREQLLEEIAKLFHKQQYDRLEKLPVADNAAIQFYELWKGGVEMEYHVNKLFFQDLYYYYPAVATKIEKQISNKFRKKFLSLLKQGIDQGDFKKSIHIEVVLESILVLYVSIVRTKQFKKYKLSSTETFQNTIAMYIRGITTNKSIGAFDQYISKTKK